MQNSNQRIIPKEFQQTIQSKPHPFQKRIQKHDLKLWEIHKLLNGEISEGFLSRALRGQRPFPGQVESRLRNILDRFDATGGPTL